jgi:aldehyde dehydrogenase (NAD+)
VAQREVGLDDGAELLLDGRRIVARDQPEGFSGDAALGLYASPRIFDKVTMNMRVAQEECFGPTINLVEVDGFEQALVAANATPYGLSSAIYTRDAHDQHQQLDHRGRSALAIWRQRLVGEWYA